MPEDKLKGFKRVYQIHYLTVAESDEVLTHIDKALDILSHLFPTPALCKLEDEVVALRTILHP
jgi:hypothetical protein